MLLSNDMTNKSSKTLEWAGPNVGVSFKDIIWTNKTSVQIKSHHPFHCYKKGMKPRYKPHTKHPVKYMYMSGPESAGATRVSMFEGIMDAPMYTQILDGCLVPRMFIHLVID